MGLASVAIFIHLLEKANTRCVYGANIGLRKRATIYQFVRDMPMLCVESWDCMVIVKYDRS